MEEGLVPVCRVDSNLMLHAATVSAHQGEEDPRSARSKTSVISRNVKLFFVKSHLQQ